MISINVTEHQLAEAFEEWFVRHNENPDDFVPTGYSPREDGELAAKYFIKLLHKID